MVVCRKRKSPVRGCWSEEVIGDQKSLVRGSSRKSRFPLLAVQGYQCKLTIAGERRGELFLKLMNLDGCFMLEILHLMTETLDDYALNDPIFSHHGRASFKNPPEKVRPRTLTMKASGDGCEIIGSATELDKARIRFKRSKNQSIKDISFCGGVLKLPQIAVDDATESMFLNLNSFRAFPYWGRQRGDILCPIHEQHHWQCRGCFPSTLPRDHL
ncbi:hypothetical protein L1049_020498 [Liquidambar formosana]|uniref:Uncharacterized protein n=1 Tax=Liquidambar formosana TaxID=63359 RepID=A0AAP0XAS5_LIQFO